MGSKIDELSQQQIKILVPVAEDEKLRKKLPTFTEEDFEEVRRRYKKDPPIPLGALLAILVASITVGIFLIMELQ